MKIFKYLYHHFQFSRLRSEWKQMFTKRYLLADLTAGTTVAFVAIPLSLAIALASGVSPGTGLITAIIAGVVCGLFGGTPLAVSGPAAAMCVLVASIVEKHGVAALLLITLAAGLMQLISGLIGLGRFAKYVPLPVIAGFTAGIGVIIFIGQLPRAFGLNPPASSFIFDVIHYIQSNFHDIKPHCLLLVFLTMGIIQLLPMLLPRVPPLLPAVIISSLAAYVFHLSDVPLIGAIPRSLPYPQLPNLSALSLQDVMFNGFVVYLLASLETLLSSSALDKMTNAKKHHSSQELIGQGLGNMAVSFFGGIPVTGVIVRSATNVRAGAKTRRASIFHSLIILLTVYAIAPIISYIPIATLSGILFSVAFSMINVREFAKFWQTARGESVIYVVTFFTIIFVGLLAGVQAGIIAACGLVLLKAGWTRTHLSTSDQMILIHSTIKGSLTFLSIGKIVALQEQIEKTNACQTVILDMSQVNHLDSSGAAAIVDLYQLCHERKIKFHIKGLSSNFESLFGICDGDHLIDCQIDSEHDLTNDGVTIPSPMNGKFLVS